EAELRELLVPFFPLLLRVGHDADAAGRRVVATEAQLDLRAVEGGVRLDPVRGERPELVEQASQLARRQGGGILKEVAVGRPDVHVDVEALGLKIGGEIESEASGRGEEAEFHARLDWNQK